MKLKPLEPGDNVKAKYIVDIHGNEGTTYIDGKLIEYSQGERFLSKLETCWLVEYSLDGVKYRDWFPESDISSKHYLATTDAELFDEAEKISIDDYNGVLFYDDRYFDSVDELLEWWEYQDVDCDPSFVWACDTNPVKLQLDLESYVSEALEEHGYEGLSERSQFEHLFDKLRFIQDNFVERAAKETVSYPNYKKAVVL